MKRICVFCGSSNGNDIVYINSAQLLGGEIAKRKYELVYGGASCGLMGAVADSALANGTKVFGVMPEALARKEISHTNLTEQFIVGSMHERKAKMAELSDAFIALPGGFGTFEEIFEVITWAQLGYHQKPCAFLNINGYYDDLVAQFNKSVNSGFIKPHHSEMVIIAKTVNEVLDKLEAYKPTVIEKWITTSNL